MQTLFQSCNPRTEEILQTFSLLSDKEIELLVSQICASQSKWRALPLSERCSALVRVAEMLEKEPERYAGLIEIEMGKLKEEAIAEIKKCAALCRYSAETAAHALVSKSQMTEEAQVCVVHQPLGVILAVMPWNFPFWQFFRAAAPLLLSGNAVLLKHASNTPQCALAIEDLFAQAFPSLHVVRSLFITNDQVNALIGHKAVKGVTLTGSKRAGVAVATAAAQAVKPCVLELGGSDPFLVFADADIEEAIRVAVTSRCLSNGQSCIAAKRFLVEHTVYDAFVEGMTKLMSARVIGPLANRQQLQTLTAQVDDAVQKGARVHCGGKPKGGTGFFYPPTVLTGLTNDMRASAEEMFGPVASIWSFRSDNEALQLANASDFGLGATLFTTNEARIESFTQDLECGQVFVNDMVRSDQRFPFGGIKESGFGRELGERAALSFTNAKTVYVKGA